MARLNNKELNKFRLTLPSYKGVTYQGGGSSSSGGAPAIPVGVIDLAYQEGVPPLAQIHLEFTGLDSGVDSINVYYNQDGGEFALADNIAPAIEYLSPDDRSEGFDYGYYLKGVLGGVEGEASNTMHVTIFA